MSDSRLFGHGSASTLLLAAFHYGARTVKKFKHTRRLLFIRNGATGCLAAVGAWPPQKNFRVF